MSGRDGGEGEGGVGVLHSCALGQWVYGPALGPFMRTVSKNLPESLNQKSFRSMVEIQKCIELKIN